MKARLVIALSGVDSAGKSTQREALIAELRRWGHSPISVWSRAGYTPRLKLAKRMLRPLMRRRRRERSGISDQPGLYPRRAANRKNGLRRWFWLTVAMLDLVWMYGVELRLWRACGRTVICDRHLLDCLVDFRVNFSDDHVERRWLCRLLRRLAVRPDAAFCLLIPAEQSMQRSRTRSRYHWETLTFSSNASTSIARWARSWESMSWTAISRWSPSRRHCSPSWRGCWDVECWDMDRHRVSVFRVQNSGRNVAEEACRVPRYSFIMRTGSRAVLQSTAEP